MPAVAVPPAWGLALDEGLDTLGLETPSTQRESLLGLIAMLACWNRVYNLTSVRDPAAMIGRHLLDSLSILPYVHGERVLDLGTGAGFPGLPLAIVDPSRSYTLLDCSGKKTRFVRQAAIELGLANVRVEHSRIQDFRPPQGFDTITARAFSSLSDMLSITHPLLRPGGVLLAMKGPSPGAEVAALNGRRFRARVVPLRVPQAEGGRHLVVISVIGA